MTTIMTTFDAIRGLSTPMASRVVDAIWSAASRDAELNEALTDAIQDLMEHEEKMVTHYRLLSDRNCDQMEDQMGNQMGNQMGCQDQLQWQEAPSWW